MDEFADRCDTVLAAKTLAAAIHDRHVLWVFAAAILLSLVYAAFPLFRVSPDQ